MAYRSYGVGHGHGRSVPAITAFLSHGDRLRLGSTAGCPAGLAAAAAVNWHTSWRCIGLTQAQQSKSGELKRVVHLDYGIFNDRNEAGFEARVGERRIAARW